MSEEAMHNEHRFINVGKHQICKSITEHVEFWRVPDVCTGQKQDMI
jgi:hypothetical protein